MLGIGGKEAGGTGEDETFMGVGTHVSGVVESLSEDESSEDDILAEVRGVSEDALGREAQVKARCDGKS